LRDHQAVGRRRDGDVAASGTTFSADNDLQPIAAAAPFSPKLMESLLAERPQHQACFAAARIHAVCLAFVQQDADELVEKDFAAGTALRTRARCLYRAPAITACAASRWCTLFFIPAALRSAGGGPMASAGDALLF
jgi:hypothetical protein